MKFFIILFSIYITLFASYEKAKEHYKNGEYQKAINEAKVSTSDYSNPKLHLIWARSAEALGRIKEAMSAYESVVILSDDIDSRLALIRIYKQTSRDELAKQMRDDLKNYQLTPEQENSLKILQKNSTSIFLSKTQANLTMGYDTNINVSATGSILDDYGLKGGEIATLFSRFNGTFSVIDDFEDKGGWYLRSDLNIYNQNNQNAHYYDMRIIGINSGLGYIFDKYSIYVPISYDILNYLGVDLLNQIKIEPQVDIRLNKSLKLEASSKYSYRDYEEIAYKTLADNSYGLGLNLRYILHEDYAYIGVNYEKFLSLKKDNPKYVDKEEFDFFLGVQHRINPLFLSKLEYKFRKIGYRDAITDLGNPVTGIKREDSYNQVEFKLSHYFLQKYELFVLGKYMNNYSTNQLSNYTKNIIMFGINSNY